MRVVDLDRDMSDVIPTSMTPDSEFLFERMTALTLDRARPGPGRRILDVASGVGQDSIALAARGAAVVGAEPSRRMSGMARLKQEFAIDLSRCPNCGGELKVIGASSISAHHQDFMELPLLPQCSRQPTE